MALGHLLRVSWICFLLFDGSTGLPAIKGYGYPYMADSRNIGDDGEDDVLSLPTFDQSNWQASNNQPTGPVYTSYNKPLVSQQPDGVPFRPNLPNTPSAPEVERLVNGESPDWGQGNLDKLLLFPLSPNYQPSEPAKPHPGPVQPQSTSLNVASTNSVPATHYASAPAYYEPASSPTSQAAKSPSFESWQPEPVSSGYGVAYSNTGFSAAGGDSSNVPRLVYEDVFQYPENTEPSQSAVSDTAGWYGLANHMSKGSSTGYAPTLGEPSFPSYPTNVGAQPVFPYGMGSPSSSFSGGENLHFGQTGYQPRDEKISWRPQKPVASTQKVEVPQRVSEPILPPPPPSSYIVQSRNGYERRRYLLNKSRYSSEFPPPMPVNSKGVKGPAPQPAAPKGVKNPQRAKW